MSLAEHAAPIPADVLWRSVPLGPRLTSVVAVYHAPGQALVSRVRDGEMLVFDLAQSNGEDAGPSAVVPVFEDGQRGSAVWSERGQFAAYCTAHSAGRLAPDGTVMWTAPFEKPRLPLSIARPDCLVSLDGRQIWVYRPDAMRDRGSGGDCWLVLDAINGGVLAQAELPTVGQGAHQVPLPDGTMLLDVGEGQDGVRLFRGRLENGALTVHDYDFYDRCLIGASPSGEEFMAVGHGEDDVTFHSVADGSELGTVDVRRTAAGISDAEASFVSWSGGFLSNDAALLVVGGVEDDSEWYRAVYLDIRSGSLNEIMAEVHAPYDVHGLGDGTWLSVDADGRLTRWALRRSAA